MEEDKDLIVDEEIVINEEIIEDEETVEEEVTENTEASEEENQENVPEEEDEEDRIVQIGEEVSEEEEAEKPETPKWVKTVRKSNRRLESENKKLKRLLEEKEAANKPAITLGEKPTLASVDYDDEKYAKELESYYERKRKVDEQNAEKARTVEEQNKVWKDRQEVYANKKKEYSFKDFADAEDIVTNTFSTVQQGIIVQGSEDSALLVYALGKNPGKLEELAKIKDPIEFAFKVAKLESKLKVLNRKAPSPEKRVSSGKAGGISGSSTNTLERLREEAAKTGDYTKVAAYNKKLRESN